jgi:hypothetical protein
MTFEANIGDKDIYFKADQSNMSFSVSPIVDVYFEMAA